MAQNQNDFADRLAHELALTGIEQADGVTLLDCLATAGLHLAEGGAPASAAYQSALAPA